MIDYDKLIESLGAELGIEARFNDEDLCELAIGESTVLSIERRAGDGTLLLTSAVADDVPDPVDYALVLDLLEFGLGSAINGTPAIGRDTESGIVVAYQTIGATALQKASIGEIVVGFLRFRDAMARKLGAADKPA
ncbi:MAG: CesT family type III secretion system chaperone [Kiritimatiellae bacterium]|nr:CesT family type III secretion system chaperone [Kiritimatiellia bacterium]